MGQQESIQCGETPTVRVEKVLGALDVRGTDDIQIEATANGQGQVSLGRDGEVIVLAADGDTRLRLPKAAKLQIVEVRQDLKVRDLKAELAIDHVRGSAQLNRVAGACIDRVGGNLNAAHIDGELTLDRAGGDVRLRDMSGAARVALGGDLVVTGAHSPLEATAGGDVALRVEIAHAEPLTIVAGGDIICRLQGSPSAMVTLACGGTRTIDLPNIVRDGSDPGHVKLGEGEAEVSLRAGGDIWLGGIGASYGVEDADAIGSRVAASVGKTLADVEAGLAAMGAVMESVPEAEISSKVQKVIKRAIRRKQRSHLKDVAPLPVAVGSGSDPGGASDEERLKILKMVEDGKLSVEDAEKLFEALGV
jgi:hypothetical protein